MKIFISKKALERAKKDKYVKEHLNEYMKEINMLTASQLKRPTERIGEFNVTPRGGRKERIAWHREGDDLYIDDFLYHERGEDYVDKWNIKARIGKIKRKDYENDGYELLKSA
ncbi:MAG: hypothetical protein N3G19_01665 [Candidatus Pacearchaeota archaeon]|nr:hypothetical protein [Candidatus Pacearchaeota archaeon]